MSRDDDDEDEDDTTMTMIMESTPLNTTDGLQTGSNEKVEALNQKFNGAFPEKMDTPFPDKGESPDPDMPTFKVDQNGINNFINKVYLNKTSGLDQISAGFLILFSDEVTSFLIVFFQQSMDNVQVPAKWNVAPIFKKGAKSDSINYRPVSLTSISCKMLKHNHCEQYDGFHGATQYPGGHSRWLQSPQIMRVPVESGH